MPPGWRRSHDQRSTDKFLVNLRFLIDKFVVCAAVLLGSFAEDPHVGAEGVVVALGPGVGVRRPSHGFPDAGKDWCDDVVTEVLRPVGLRDVYCQLMASSGSSSI